MTTEHQLWLYNYLNVWAISTCPSHLQRSVNYWSWSLKSWIIMVGMSLVSNTTKVKSSLKLKTFNFNFSWKLQRILNSNFSRYLRLDSDTDCNFPTLNNFNFNSLRPGSVWNILLEPMQHYESVNNRRSQTSDGHLGQQMFLKSPKSRRTFEVEDDRWRWRF